MNPTRTNYFWEICIAMRFANRFTDLNPSDKGCVAKIVIVLPPFAVEFDGPRSVPNDFETVAALFKKKNGRFFVSTDRCDKWPCCCWLKDKIIGRRKKMGDCSFIWIYIFCQIVLAIVLYLCFDNVRFIWMPF